MANFIVEDFKRIFTNDNPLSKIIVLNVIAFVATNLIDSFIPVISWLAIPGDITRFIYQFWSIITYMFLHAGFMHILFNMLWLYWIGKILMEYLGNRRLVTIYFMGGVVGGLMYLIVYNVLAAMGSYPMGSLLLGASAGVMAVVVATATLLPDYRIHLLLLGPVPLKYLALGAVILTSVLDFSVNMGGKLAHLGGAAVGFLFIRRLQAGKDGSVLFYGLLDQLKRPFMRKKMRVVHNSTRKRATKTQSTGKSYQNMTEQDHQQKIDGILDKISKSGYDSLTDAEKEYLFKASGRK